MIEENKLNLSSIQSYKVAKYLLEEKASSQMDISIDTGVAVGYVNEVVHELSDLNIVRIEYRRTLLLDYVKLLEKISFDRPFKKLVYRELRLPTSTINETEKMVTSYCTRYDIEYVYTMYSALRHYYEYQITYPSVHVYMKNPEKIEGLEPGEGVVPIVILSQDRPDIMEQSIIKNRNRVCDRVQVIIDLYSSGVGRDAAIRFYRDTIWKT